MSEKGVRNRTLKRAGSMSLKCQKETIVRDVETTLSGVLLRLRLTSDLLRSPNRIHSAKRGKTLLSHSLGPGLDAAI